MQTSFPVRVVSFWALCLLTVIAVISTAGPLLRPRPALPRPAPVLEQTLPHVREVPQRMSVIGYEREHFGAWASAIPEGCPMGNTRDVMLLESFPQESCTPKGLIDDPYDGDPISPHDTDIDHIFPLSAAWDMGAHSWTPEQRRAFANDPSNLVAVSSSANRQKSDKLPAEWMPSSRGARCWYARRVSYIAYSYDLELTRADKQVMESACRLIF